MPLYTITKERRHFYVMTDGLDRQWAVSGVECAHSELDAIDKAEMRLGVRCGVVEVNDLANIFRISERDYINTITN